MEYDEFEVGDTVYCLLYGKGECIAIKENERYPIVVKTEKGIIIYTKEGKESPEQNRSIFFEEIKIPESAYKRPRWRAEKQDSYCFIAGTGLVTMQKDFGSFENDKHFKHGNYFKTEEEAKESKFYKVFH